MSRSQITQAVKVLTEYSGESDDRNISRGRIAISCLVNNFLSDVSMVSESLQNLGLRSEAFMSLQWCQHCIKTRPDLFFHPTPAIETIATKQSHVFCCWFIGRLVCLLGIPDVVCHRENCVTIISQLLQLLLFKDFHMFRHLIQELICTLGDLVQINEKMFYSSTTGSFDLNKFQVSMKDLHESLVDTTCEPEEEITLSQVTLHVQDVEQCEFLQVGITNVFQVVITDISLFDLNQLKIIWGCLCCQLEYGTLDLKIASLSLLSTILHDSGLPVKPIKNYFLSCVESLIKLMLSGCEGLEPGRVLILEDKFGNMLREIVCCDNKTDEINHLTVPQLQNMLWFVTNCISEFGFSRLRSESFGKNLAVFICHLMTKIPKTMLMVSKPLHDRLMSCFINAVGSAVPHEFLLMPLCDLIIDDANDIDANMNSRNTKTKSRRTETEVKMPTFKKLIEKVKTMINNKEDTEMHFTSKAVNLLIEVITRCVIMAQQQNFATRFCEFSRWISCSVMKQIVEFWTRYLHELAVSSDDVNENFQLIIKTIGSVLAVEVKSAVDQDLLTDLAWMISIPWMPNDQNWLDLKPTNPKDIGKLSRKLSEKIDVVTSCLCLEILVLLPKSSASMWRIHVFKQVCGGIATEIRLAAVKSFPVLLENLGSNRHYLIKELFHPMIEDRDVKVQTELAHSLGRFVCIVNGQVSFGWDDFSKDLEPMYKHQTLKCEVCDNDDEETNLCSLHVSHLDPERETVDPSMFTLFFNLLSKDDIELKRAFICSLRQLFSHVVIQMNDSSTISMVTECLKLIKDENYLIRFEFSKVVHYMLIATDSSRGEATKTDHIIVQTLKESYVQARSENNTRLQETVALTIGQLGRVAEGDLLLVVVVSLLNSSLSHIPLVAATSHIQLQAVAKYKNSKPQTFFMDYRKAICGFLVQTMHDALMGAEGDKPEDILRQIAKTLGFADVKCFLQGCEKYMLPDLVSKATPAATAIIKLLASLLSVPNRRIMLINNTKYIFSYLMRFCQRSDVEKALNYLQSETDFELGSLLRLHFQRVHNELLLHLSTNYTQVFAGLKTLALNDERYKGPRDITTPEQMADYLEPRLLGVLAFFDSQLMTSSISLQDKKVALESLISIIRLMGTKHISSIRHKIMNTLRLGLKFQDKDFVEISCRAWNCFVRSLELPLLGAMLPQIIATLLPLLESLPAQVSDIFSYMIVENSKSLHHHFHEIYFLPDIPELADAKAVLRMYTDGPSSQSDFKMHLEHSIKGVTHESLDVRIHALSKLRNLLRREKCVLYDYVLGSESADPIISRLVSVLLTGCRESDGQAECLYAECLGELGAVDPGRLEMMHNNPKEEMAKFQPNIDDENFAVGLINNIIKAYLAATDPTKQDCSAYALQELLQIYRVSEPRDSETPTTREGRASKLWKRFPVDIQELLIPLLSSKYMLAQETDWSNMPKPLFRSKKGDNFKDWVSNWTGYLISKVKLPKASQIFQACSVSIRHNTHVALYLIPHVIGQVLLDGKEVEVTEIHNEILEVLNQVQKPDTQRGSSSDFSHKSAQTVFSILDYLTKWQTYRAQLKAAEHPNPKEAVYLKDSGYRAVTAFLNRIPQNLLAQACFNCEAFTRSLMHFEQFVSGSKQSLQPHLDFLQKLYVSMDESDGVVGVVAIRQSQATLTQQILSHESLGQQQDAQACYERAIQLQSSDVSLHRGLLRSLIELGQPFKALMYATGVMTESPSWESDLNSYRVEAAWKLGRWDQLEIYTKPETHSRNWPVVVGKLLLSARDRKENDFFKELEMARREQMGPLAAASMESGSYQRGYEYIARLHMLNDIEESMQVLGDFPAHNSDSDPYVKMTPECLLDQWHSGLQVVQSSFRIQEPILALRRALVSLANENNEDEMLNMQVGKWWLSSAKVARKAGYLEAVNGCLLQASAYNLPEFSVEKAKWLWEKGENDGALSCLEKSLAVHFSDATKLKLDNSEDALIRRRMYAETLLLRGRYSEETSSMESNAIVKLYKDVIEMNPVWEDGYFHLAKYYDKIMTTIIDDKDRPEKQGEFIIYVVKYFGQSLQYGNLYIYQSMPRLLSLWLDYGTAVVESEKKDSKRNYQKVLAQKAVLMRINNVIAHLSETLTEYQFFTAFPQLISRICHAQPDVFQQLKNLIAKILVCYPQQAMWMLMAVSKSSYPMRVKRCQEIFDTAILMNPDLCKFIQDATKLTERLIDVCDKKCETTTLSISTHFKPLKRLLEDSNFSSIMLPLQSAMTVMLPTNKSSHVSAFSTNQVYISGFEDTIEVLPSLQRPKKITMIGSDGKCYVMMCKPKDDLRKDCRLMEFNGIVNRFLHKDAESSHRQLHIRTYTVIPLNEECGLLEWVNNTQGLRYIVVKLYKEKGLYTTGKELKAMQPSLHSTLDVKLQIYRERFLPRHPPVFKEWFLRTFPDPASWYNARLSYARTCAVMSIVGYILGLGDRHGENILFDSTTGDCVHVDFNCLFNKGETFEWPERVPFRLTPNMIDVLGPMGVEGVFRRACEEILRVMRNQMDPLMSVLKPFIHDPLVEWSKPPAGKRSNPTESGEISNEQAMNHVQNIEHRLKGILKNKTKPRGLPLSIEGHVNYLIQEATDEKNLCQMYVGWAPYM